MSSGELVIDQAGATGPVNELFRQTIANPLLRMRLGRVATAREENVGDRLGDHDPNCPDEWTDIKLISLKDLAEGTEAGVVFSGLQAEPAAEYEDRLAEGRLVVSNASANRMRLDVPLVNAFINGHQIDELYQRDVSGRIMAGGNCMSGIIAVPAYPIHQAIGIQGMRIETMQGWSGAGKDEVPPEASDFPPVGGDENDKIMTEPNMFLGASMEAPADIHIGAHAKRGPWLRGHHAKITARLDRETTRHEIEELWRHFKAPEALDAVKPEVRALSQVEGEKWPRRYQQIKPVRLRYEDLVRRDREPIKLKGGVHPMRVKAHLLEVEARSPDMAVFEVTGDNLMLGAVGVNLLNVVYARAQGYLG